MSDVAVTVTPLSKDVPYRQAQMPNYLTGTFVGDDTDNHDMRVDGRGKGRSTIAVNNPCNQDLVVTVYGMHAVDGAVGDAGTFLVGTFTVTAVENQDYETVNDPFPWYLVRMAFSVAPDDDPLVSVTAHVDFSAF